MNWTEPQPPNDYIKYDHATLETPIGTLLIDWKGWKEQPSYDITIGNEWIGTEFTLEDAKRRAENYIKEIYDKLGLLIQNK